jgi:phage-related tail fiber protein
MNYYSIITNNGLINHANASSSEINLDLTQMAVGDSNGVYYDPDGTETTLQNELYRVDLTHAVIDENNPNQLIVEAVLGEVIGPFYIREVGIFDSNGNLFAIGKFPETFKPNLPSGSGKRLYIRMILGFASSPNVNLIINNDIALDPNFSTDVNNEIANINQRIDAINSVPAGAIFAIPTINILSGYLECNGAEINRSTYSDLFNIIGANFGAGDGISTFNIPDLRGEFIRGFDNGRGIDSGRSFGSFQNDEFQSHGHNFRQSTSYSSLFNPVKEDHIPMGVSIPPAGTRTGSGIIYNSGGSETRPRNIAMKYVIKY